MGFYRFFMDFEKSKFWTILKLKIWFGDKTLIFLITIHQNLFQPLSMYIFHRFVLNFFPLFSNQNHNSTKIEVKCLFWASYCHLRKINIISKGKSVMHIWTRKSLKWFIFKIFMAKIIKFAIIQAKKNEEIATFCKNNDCLYFQLNNIKIILVQWYRFERIYIHILFSISIFKWLPFFLFCIWSKLHKYWTPPWKSKFWDISNYDATKANLINHPLKEN
jgi:hypothetical protein